MKYLNYWIVSAFALLFMVLFWGGALSPEIAQFLSISGNMSFALLDRIATLSSTISALLWALLLGSALYILLVNVFKKQDLTFSFRPIWFLLLFFLTSLVLFSASWADMWVVDPHLPMTESQLSEAFLQEYGLSADTSLHPINIVLHFISMWSYAIGAMSLIVLSAIGFGSFITKKYKDLFEHTYLRWFTSMALGFGVIIFLSMLTSVVMGMSLITATVIIITGAMLALVRERALLHSMCIEKKTYTLRKSSLFIEPILVTTLLLIFSLAFVHVLRPFPIGWDDIGVYMTIPKLFAETGQIVTGYGAHNWGIIMSYGFSVFHEPFVAMSFSFLGGLLACWALFFLTTYIQKKETVAPLVVTTLVATTPFILFQLSNDMKVDLAALFFSIVVMMVSLMLTRRKTIGEHKWYLWIILGALFGLTLGIKYTAFLLFVLTLSLIASACGKRLLLFSGFLLTIGVVCLANLFQFSGIDIPSMARLIIGILTLATGITGVLLGAYKGEYSFAWLKKPVISLLTTLLVMLPWMLVFQSSCTASCDISMHQMLYGTPQMAEPPMLLRKSAISEDDVVSLQQDTEAMGGGKVEELGRYAGFDGGIFQLFSIPVDTAFTRNVQGDFVAVGWVFMTLFIFLLFSLVSRWKTPHFYRPIVIYLALAAGILATVAISFTGFSVGASSGALNYILPLLPLLLFFKVRDNDESSRYLILGGVLYLILWIYLASGVIWYGIAGFVVMAMLALVILFCEQQAMLFQRMFVTSFVLLWVFPMWFYTATTSATSQLVAYRSIPEGQSKQEISRFTLSISPHAMRSYDQRGFTMFKMGLINAEEAFLKYNRGYAETAAILNESSKNIYRIGTLLPYFIHEGMSRIYTDNQLDYFLQLYTGEGTEAEVTGAFREADFEYIIFDKGTATIDQTNNQTLSRKVALFEQFVNNAPDLEVVNDTTTHTLFHIRQE